MNIVKYLEKLSSVMDFVCKWLVIPLFASLVIVFLSQIVLRFLFGASLLWYLDYIRLAYALALFLSVPVAFKSKQHIMLGILADRITGMPKHLLILFLHLCSLLFFVFMVVYGYSNMIESMDRVLSTMPISMAWKSSGIPIAGAVMIIHLLPMLIKDIQNIMSNGSDNLSYYGSKIS